MSLLLGVDTGGTYTDAVLIEDEARIVASAKSLTTRQDLAIGVGKAVAEVLRVSGRTAGDVRMAALSTTLATNALVEGQGGRAALIYIGFREADLEAHGLAEALGSDPVCVLAGGHNHAGAETDALDEAALRAFLDAHGAHVSAFAVASKFATRNPAHEVRAAEMVAQLTGRPVSASHQLAAKLGGPKRALTALLNARLVGMIDALIGRAEDQLRDMGVDAPLMVVRGDGALMSAAEARRRPIETILSGPAASLVGARWLTGAENALVSDIGGTTTDVALIRDGRPALDPEGAKVGPYRTMVEAVRMRTFGLGGDSEVHLIAQGLKGGVRLGPRRVVPVSLMAVDAPDVVLSTLERQANQPVPGEYDARFVRRVPGVAADGLAARDRELLTRVGDGVRPLNEILRSRIDSSALRRLVSRGLVQMSGVTPSDAAHVLGFADAWNRDAAAQALEVFRRRRDGSGTVLAKSTEDLARTIVDEMTRATGLVLLETAFAEEGLENPADLAAHALMDLGLAQHHRVVRLSAGLGVPLIGLGASAPVYYPAVGERMGTQTDIPEHAGVANAIGAVVGRVVVRREGVVTAQGEGRYLVHLEHGPETFADKDAALDAMENALRARARTDAEASGAEDVELAAHREVLETEIEARVMFVEARITVEASGRPRLAE